MAITITDDNQQKTKEFDAAVNEQLQGLKGQIDNNASPISVGSQFTYTGAIDTTTNVNEGILKDAMSVAAKNDVTSEYNIHNFRIRTTSHYTLPNTVFVMASQHTGQVVLSMFIIRNPTDLLTGEQLLASMESGQINNLVSDIVDENLKEQVMIYLNELYGDPGVPVLSLVKIIGDEELADQAYVTTLVSNVYNDIILRQGLLSGRLTDVSLGEDIVPNVPRPSYQISAQVMSRHKVADYDRVEWEAQVRTRPITQGSQHNLPDRLYKSVRGYVDTVFREVPIEGPNRQVIGFDKIVHPMVVLTDTDPVTADTTNHAILNVLIGAVVASDDNVFKPIWQNAVNNNTGYVNKLVNVDNVDTTQVDPDPIDINVYDSREAQLQVLKRLYAGVTIYAIDIDTFGGSDAGFKPFLRLAEGDMSAGDDIIRSLVRFATYNKGGKEYTTFSSEYPTNKIVSSVIQLPKGTMTSKSGAMVSLDTIDIPFLLSTGSEHALEWVNWYNAIMSGSVSNSYMEMLMLYNAMGLETIIHGWKGRVLLHKDFIAALITATKNCGFDPEYETLVINGVAGNYRYQAGAFDNYIGDNTGRYQSYRGNKGGNYIPSPTGW